MVGSFLLWYKFFLPASYYAVAILLASIVTLQIVLRKDLLVLQIAFLFLFLNSIYYIATNYQIIPFWDGNWDFASTKIFIDERRIFSIPSKDPPVNFGNYPSNILSIYSGWPLLHLLALFLSQVSGIDLFLVAQCLPLLIGLASFLFAHLIIKKIGCSLRINTQAINFALLLYVTSAEALRWPMLFVRQNLGLLLLNIIIYVFYLSWAGSVHSRKHSLLIMFFVMALVMAHHFTSVIMLLIFLLFFIIQKAQTFLYKVKFKNTILNIHISRTSVYIILLAASIFMFLWWGWGDFATLYVWRKLRATLIRPYEIFTGARAISYLPPPAYYPESIRPQYITILLTIRDLAIYVPAIFGFLIVVFKRNIFNNQFSRDFVTFSTIILGSIFIFNYLIFRLEIYRIFVMMLPLIVLLTSVFFFYLQKKGKIRRILVVGITSLFLVSTAFIGLWGHRFAPLHLYKPEIKFSDAGERYTDVIRTSYFFDQKIRTDHFQIIWVDDSASIVSLLKPKDYFKVMVLNDEYVTVRSTKRPQFDELICELHNFNLYRYFTGGTTSTTPETGEFLEQRLNDFVRNNPLSIRIFDDGKYRFWIYKGSTSR
jgi:hypothetical protein